MNQHDILKTAVDNVSKGQTCTIMNQHDILKTAVDDVSKGQTDMSHKYNNINNYCCWKLKQLYSIVLKVER